MYLPFGVLILLRELLLCPWWHLALYLAPGIIYVIWTNCCEELVGLKDIRNDKPRRWYLNIKLKWSVRKERRAAVARTQTEQARSGV